MKQLLAYPLILVEAIGTGPASAYTLTNIVTSICRSLASASISVLPFPPMQATSPSHQPLHFSLFTSHPSVHLTPMVKR